MMRLFIAMPLSENVEKALEKIIFVFSREEARVKWVDPKNIHLTLKFLGESDKKLIPSISDAISRAAQKYGKVTGFIDSVGGFPNLKRPRVIWAGFSKPVDILARIAGEIEDEMVPLGFEKENRPFKSHLTLGRVKDSRWLGNLPEVINGYQVVPEKVEFDRIVLFKSTLTLKGPIYERLFEAGLKTE